MLAQLCKDNVMYTFQAKNWKTGGYCLRNSLLIHITQYWKCQIICSLFKQQICFPSVTKGKGHEENVLWRIEKSTAGTLVRSLSLETSGVSSQNCQVKNISSDIFCSLSYILLCQPQFSSQYIFKEDFPKILSFPFNRFMMALALQISSEKCDPSFKNTLIVGEKGRNW